ncbi:unnamed protein product [Kluyveromyces dobzhanskii CBS 2104]|uniref:WGS project CCBQ000000000 data, contig 00015 n=1 Tax=Kluyveromyces dobzhanskii CBS 2104 TaxID=1427455 RepID=A0A0A8LBU6_9SACH|nr:unnamed protein product [Kluyveromyces dobzhanskii CBS 2104]
MSEYQALLKFNRQAVNLEMVHFLAATAASVISINDTDVQHGDTVSLVDFIKSLIRHSNVQTPTLMATTVYLIKLRSILPSDVCGIETTRHRIFIGCLVLAAKNLNDSSPLNKHWMSYTDGLFSLDDLNTIERELLSLFNWNLNFTTRELTQALSHFLVPIQYQLSTKSIPKQDSNSNHSHLLFNAPISGRTKQFFSADAHSRSSSHLSIPSLSSSNTLSTIDSMASSSSSIAYSSSSSGSSSSGNYVAQSKLKVISEEPSAKNSPRRKFGLTKPIILNSKSPSNFKASPAYAVTSTNSISSKSGWASIFH